MAPTTKPTPKPDTTARKRRRVILYGDAGTLKTTAACKFPRPYVIQDALSEGAAHLKETPKRSVNTLADFTSACKAIPDECDTVVLDDFDLSVDRWARSAEAACKSFDKRQAYRPLYNTIMPALQDVLMSGRNVVITLHAKREQELSPGKEGVFRPLVRPDLPEELERYMRSVVEVVAYTYNNGTASALTVESATEKRRIVAKRRCGMTFGDIVHMAQFAQVVMQ